MVFVPPPVPQPACSTVVDSATKLITATTCKTTLALRMFTLLDRFRLGSCARRTRRALQSCPSCHSFADTEIALGQPTTRVFRPTGVVTADLMRTFEHHKHEHPLIGHFSQNPQARVAKISDFLTQREFQRLGLYNEFFRKIDVEHQVVI